MALQQETRTAPDEAQETRPATAAKLIELEALARLVEGLKVDGKRVVHCHGTFDPLHIGHIHHFQEAAKLGDVLVVTVTPDRFVNKGPQRPLFSEGERAKAIAALECVDYVVVNAWPMAIETIQLLKPDVFVKGAEFADRSKDRTGAIALEEAAVEAVGGRLALTGGLTFSASRLVNQHLGVFPGEVQEFLARFSSRHSAGDVLRYVDGARALRVLVVGEAIVDEYQYCEAIGKSSKEPTLVVRQQQLERFPGGVLAIANHAANFAGATAVTTLIGDAAAHETHEAFIRAGLHADVQPRLLTRTGAPTIVKRRFVEGYFFTKLLEVYVIDDAALEVGDERRLCDALEAEAGDFDVVIVADFGHGMLTPRVVDLLQYRAKFLALNVQSNAGNLGYQTLRRFRRADYVCVNENEMRLEARDRRGDLRGAVESAAAALGCHNVLVTRGKSGSLCFNREHGFVAVPSFATHVVDRVGAGDAVLAVTSLCVAQGAPMEVVGFIGNAVGAQAVGTVGNARSVERMPLVRQIESLMK